MKIIIDLNRSLIIKFSIVACLIGFVLTLFFFGDNKSKNIDVGVPLHNDFQISQKPKLYYTLFESLDNTWGYIIYNDSVPFINQPNIPGLPGNRGFTDKEKASKVAGLVIYKIQNGILPPTVSITELEQLNALN